MSQQLLQVILHFFVGDWDWFLETTEKPTNTRYKVVQRAMIITYDNNGNAVYFLKSQRSFETFEYGTPDQYERPINYISEPFEMTGQVFGVAAASVNYNCGGCLTPNTVWDKYWDFILSPNESKNNRLNADKMKFLPFLIFFTLNARCQSDKDIVLVNVGNLDRAGIAKEISIINSLDPKVIAIDLQFSTSHFDERDVLLSKALESCENLVMPSLLENVGEKIMIFPGGRSEFYPSGIKTGFINTVFEDDETHTLKKFMVWEEESYTIRSKGKPRIEYHFAVQVAMAYDSLKTMKFIRSHGKLVDVDYLYGKRAFKTYSDCKLPGK